LPVAARQAQPDAGPYTFRLGDFKVLVSPSLALEYNDNIAISQANVQSDELLKPLLQLNASYPISAWNLLRLNLGIGYDHYFEHSQYDAFRLQSGSELAFDMYVDDFWINLHDRFNYSQNSGGVSAVANTARYGGLDNTAGLTTTWDLRDLVLTLGYDHENFISSSGQFNYLDRSSELPLARAGFRVQPRLTTGVEVTGSVTSYEQAVLNNNTGYSAGVYADWQPGSYFRVQPRVGYTEMFFEQTSRSIHATDEGSWYASLVLTHDITEAISYSITAGHELRLGIEADSIEDTYVRPSVGWRIIKDLTLAADLSYETGTQGSFQAGGGVHEAYDYFGGGINASHAITKKLILALYYRHTLRSSNVAGRDYAQNLVGLQLTYSFQ
jgi:hypothetical protein